MFIATLLLHYTHTHIYIYIYNTHFNDWMWIYIYIYIYIHTHIYDIHTLTTGCVMQSSSNELITRVSGKAKCTQAKADTKCVITPKVTYVVSWQSIRILSLR